jgi:DNA (cytosine-5)-methyltransferase 1
MYEESNRKYFHGQWLQHGSQTVLQEAAHPSILFSMLECDDIPLESIVTRCNLIVPQNNDNTLLLDYDPQHENNFVCGSVSLSVVISPAHIVFSLTWDEDRSAFVDFSKDQIDHALQHCPVEERCLSCGMRAQRQQFKIPQFIKPDLLFLGIRFRKHDFAYVANDSNDNLYTIGQILFIGDNLMVALRIYERRQNVEQPFDEVCRMTNPFANMNV